MGLAFSETDEQAISWVEWEAPTAAYIHIPFCRRRCFYCDFPISVVGDHRRGDNSQAIHQYVDWLCQEIRATTTQGQPLDTIFFGGGTPSLLMPYQVQQVLTALQQQFGFTDAPEISLEMDPGTFSLNLAQGFHGAGINRVSLGAQAFQDNLLQACGRTHCVRDIHEAMAILFQAGFANISLDLISGLPHQTVQQWQQSLAQAIALTPQHVSAYDMVLEPSTVFGKRFAVGEQPLPQDEITAYMYRLASETLQSAGYLHYEISNYAKPSFACRHNLVYWRNGAYYGFGMGATSYVQGQRFSRPRTQVTYGQWLQTYIAQNGTIHAPHTSPSDRLFESFMLGLRRTRGIDLAGLDQYLVNRLHQSLKPYQDEGWVQFTSDGYLRLSDPEGFLFSNTILVALWQALLENDITVA
jgi:putative oxygen-independent coproporphyrinogen III oxidase